MEILWDLHSNIEKVHLRQNQIIWNIQQFPMDQNICVKIFIDNYESLPLLPLPWAGSDGNADDGVDCELTGWIVLQGVTTSNTENVRELSW